MLSADMKSIQAYLEQSIPENVELIPAQSNIHPYLREADLMLNLSNPVFVRRDLWYDHFRGDGLWCSIHCA